jgi:hypothetical protein
MPLAQIHFQLHGEGDGSSSCDAMQENDKDIHAETSCAVDHMPYAWMAQAVRTRQLAGECLGKGSHWKGFAGIEHWGESDLGATDDQLQRETLYYLVDICYFLCCF